jgi:hypothetical protein
MQLSPESGNDRSPSPESGKHVWPDPAEIARFWQGTSGPGQIRPDPVILAGSRQNQWPDPVRSGRISAIWPDPAGSVSGSGQIWPFWPNSARSVSGFGQIRPDSGRFLSTAGFRPDSAGIRRGCQMSPDSGCIPAAGSISVVGFRRRHYSSDLMMPDSVAAYFRTTDYCRIRTVRYQMCV